MTSSLTKSQLDDLTYEVVGAAIEVHKIMGSGLLENLYHACMKEELLFRNINFLTQFKIPVSYKNKELTVDFRCDLFVEDCLVVELKAVKDMHPSFDAQLLTYMKLLKAPKGILFNFNCSNIFNQGQRTFVNDYFRDLKP